MLWRRNMVYFYALRYNAIITKRNDRCLLEKMTFSTENVKPTYTDKGNKTLKDVGVDMEKVNVEEI